jgi:hypothetical protein
MEHEDLRRRVWDEMLFAGMRASYFAELVRHYSSLEKAIRVLLLLASSGAAATVLTSAPEWVKFLFPLAATGGSLWLIFSQYGMFARDAADLHAGWSELQADYERLWNNLDGGELLFDQIYARGNELSKAGTKFPNKKKHLQHWLDQATEIAQAKYA